VAWNVGQRFNPCYTVGILACVNILRSGGFGVFFVKYYSWEGDTAARKLNRGQTRKRGGAGGGEGKKAIKNRFSFFRPLPLSPSRLTKVLLSRGPFYRKFLLLANCLPKNTPPQTACYAGYRNTESHVYTLINAAVGRLGKTYFLTKQLEVRLMETRFKFGGVEMEAWRIHSYTSTKHTHPH